MIKKLVRRVKRYIIERSDYSIWQIAYRIVEEKDLFAGNTGQYFTLIENPKGYWCADPIPYKLNDKMYVFCEMYEERMSKGRIGVCEWDEKNKCFKPPKVVIREDFHMSFPYIFKYGTGIYMLPEVSGDSSIRIYQMGESVYDWSLYLRFPVEKLISDSVVYDYERIKICCTSHSSEAPLKNQLLFYEILGFDNPVTAKLKLMQSSQFEYLSNCRNAGRFLEKENRLFRVVQMDDKGTYGEALGLKEIKKITGDEFKESSVLKRIEAEDVRLKKYSWMLDIQGVHSYGKVDTMEVVDLFARKATIRSLFFHYMRILNGKKF